MNTDACTCLSGCLEWGSSEDQVAAFAQVVIVHALGDLGNGIISRQALQGSIVLNTDSLVTN